MAHIAQVQEKVNKNGLNISATIFSDGTKVSKATIPFDFSNINPKTGVNQCYMDVIRKALTTANLNKLKVVPNRVATKGVIKTYTLE